MSRTYDFMMVLARNYALPPARLLDFGCGGGALVDLALAAGFDAFGVDTFDAVWEQFQPPEARHGGRVLKITPGAGLPFEKARFEIVVSNQVFEHVRDLGPVIAELARVLPPGGTLIAIFPTREVIMEPHLKAPFVHWFVPGSASQSAALRASHALRLCNRPHQERSSWVAEEQGNLQRQIFYRSVSATIDAFRPWFDLKAREEAGFLRHRLALHPRLAMAAKLPRVFDPLFAQATIRLANAVLIFERRSG